MRFSPRVDRIAGRGADAWAVAGRAWEMIEGGRDVVMLTVGDPDFDTPAAIRESAKAALDAGRTHYGEIAGLRALREAIAARWTPGAAAPIAPERVNIHNGAQNAMYSVIQCLVGEGDEVLVPEPTYVTYEALIGAAGGRMVPVRSRPERDFHLDPAELEAAVTPRTRVIVLNSPNNPTGAVYGRDEIEAVADICRRHDLWLVCDEVYRDMTFDIPHTSPLALPEAADRAVAIGSLSKSHAMSGWRLGWSVAPAELARHITRLGLCLMYGVPTFIQDAALVAVTHDLPETEAMRQAYRRRRDLVLERLGPLNSVRAIAAEGGMFVMADVRATGLSGIEFANRLLDAEAVAVLPGEGFGAAADGHIRISLACEDDRLADACDRIARFAQGAARAVA